MPTYPLTFPAVGLTQAKFRRNVVASQNESIFSMAQQAYKFPGERWEGDVTFTPMKQSEVAEVQAFFDDLYGVYGTFLYGDPMYLAFGKRGVGGGAPVVNGAGQTGNTLNISGCPVSTTGWLKKADYFQLGSGATARLYRLNADVNSDASGNATLTFNPALRSSPADLAALTIDNPMTVMKAASNVSETDSYNPKFYTASFSFIESLP